MTSSKSDESEVWVGDDVEVDVPYSISIILAEFEISGLPLEAVTSEVAASDPAANTSASFSSSPNTISCCRSLVSSIPV